MKTYIYNKVAAVTNSSPKLGEVPQAEGSVITAATSALTDPLGASATPPNLGGELDTPHAEVTDSSPKLGEVPVGGRSVCGDARTFTHSPRFARPSNLEGQYKARTHNLSATKSLRHELRTNGTAAEATMWKMLKARQVMGKKFRRQFSIESYVLDFYCPEAHLAVELDGQPHYTIEGDLHDTDRDEHLLATHGIRTLRFENCDVFRNPEGVLAEIKEALATNCPPKLGGRAKRRGSVITAATSALTDPLGASATPPNLGGESVTPNLVASNLEGQLGTTIRKASVLCTLCAVLFLAACTQEESILPAATDDALAALPADTRVGIQAEITDNREQSTVTRAEGDAPTYYALDEIHPDKEVYFKMDVPGGSDKTQLYPTAENGYLQVIPFNTLADTEPFSTLRLKDFNLTEGNDRRVSRWTVLKAEYNGMDYLYGWARLTADATGRPVLDYGEMKRADAKVTIIVQDEKGQPVNVSGGGVTASLSLPLTTSEVIYTPEGAGQGMSFKGYSYTITTLEADEAIDPDRIGLAVFANGTTNTDYGLNGMVTADETGDCYYGKDNNTLTAIVRATATHTIEDNTNFTPIPAADYGFTGTEVLTIEVLEDPDGEAGPMTTGKYSLALSDIVLQEESAAIRSASNSSPETGVTDSSPKLGEVPVGGRGLSAADFTDPSLITDPLGASATLQASVAQSTVLPSSGHGSTFSASSTAFVAPNLGEQSNTPATRATGSTLTALKPGEHYILTVTLRHNMLVSATATIGEWSEAAADVTLGGDDAKLPPPPPFTYDADTDTYTILELAGLEEALADRAANDPDATSTVVMDGTTLVPGGVAADAVAVVSGAETDLATVQAAISGKTHIIVTGETLAYYSGYYAESVVGMAISLLTGDGNGNIDPDSPNAGTISLVLPEVTTMLQNGADFYGCAALKSVSLPKATSIGNAAFQDCTSLASVSAPEATSIGSHAFDKCYAFAYIMADKATSIGIYAFGKCHSLASVSLPAVTTIGEHAFCECPILMRLSFGSVITSVGVNAFKESYGGINFPEWTPNCTLTLAKGQKVLTWDETAQVYIPADDAADQTAADASAEADARTWAGYTWKEIKLTETSNE